MKNTNKVKLILMAMAMMLINTSALAQVKVMPISKLNDGYLVLQDNKVPIYELMNNGACPNHHKYPMATFMMVA